MQEVTSQVSQLNRYSIPGALISGNAKVLLMMLQILLHDLGQLISSKESKE